MLDEAQLKRIPDPQTRHLVQQLANLLEQALTDTDGLRAEVQRLKDEINRLKGEQGKPHVKPSKPAPAATDPSSDHSSEQPRKRPATWKKGAKNHRIVVTRTQTVRLDPATLPSDALFKGYERVVVQNLRLTPDNVTFERAKFYAPSTGKTYLAPLPPGYTGGFGPDLRALMLSLHHVGNVSQPALHTLLTHAGIVISSGQVNNLLVAGHERFHHEKQAIRRAGLASSPWQQTDDTATRVDGVNHHAHVLTNPLYTTYTTLPRKDRLSVLRVLHNAAPLSFVLNADVLASQTVRALPHKTQRALSQQLADTRGDEAWARALLSTTRVSLSASATKSVLEAMALAAYRTQNEVPVVDLLVCDDAPQFVGLTAELALCWVHDARHYQKLTPPLAVYRQILTRFQEAYWAYYDRLLAYRKEPTPAARAALSAEFDALFVADTGYGHLDYRIGQTLANKTKLLAVISHPELPLHNNASELAVRRRVRKRDVSFGPRSACGVTAWDTFQSLAATAQKLGVSFLAYLLDRVSERNALPSLASVITERARELHLGASWA